MPLHFQKQIFWTNEISVGSALTRASLSLHLLISSYMSLWLCDREKPPRKCKGETSRLQKFCLALQTWNTCMICSYHAQHNQVLCQPQKFSLGVSMQGCGHAICYFLYTSLRGSCLLCGVCITEHWQWWSMQDDACCSGYACVVPWTCSWGFTKQVSVKLPKIQTCSAKWWHHDHLQKPKLFSEMQSDCQYLQLSGLPRCPCFSRWAALRHMNCNYVTQMNTIKWSCLLHVLWRSDIRMQSRSLRTGCMSQSTNAYVLVRCFT